MAVKGASMAKSVFFIIVGLMLFILYLYFFVGFSDILTVLRGIDPLKCLVYYSLTVVIVTLSMIFYSLTWYELLRALSVDMDFRRALTYAWVAAFVDLIIPAEAVIGDVTKIYLASKNSSGEVESQLGRITASIVIHKILSMMMILAGLLISSLSILNYEIPPYVSNLLIAVIGGTAVSIGLLIYLSIDKGAAEGAINIILKLASTILRGRINQASLRERMEYTISAFYRGMEVISGSPSLLLKPILYAFLAWFLHMLTYPLIFYALDYMISINISIVVYSVSMAVQTIPIGFPVVLVEIVMISNYTMFGVPSAVSGVATTLIRVVTFWFLVVTGYVMTQWIGIRVLIRGG